MRNFLPSPDDAVVMKIHGYSSIWLKYMPIAYHVSKNDSTKILYIFRAASMICAYVNGWRVLIKYSNWTQVLFSHTYVPSCVVSSWTLYVWRNIFSCDKATFLYQCLGSSNKGEDVEVICDVQQYRSGFTERVKRLPGFGEELQERRMSSSWKERWKCRQPPPPTGFARCLREWRGGSHGLWPHLPPCEVGHHTYLQERHDLGSSDWFTPW